MELEMRLSAMRRCSPNPLMVDRAAVRRLRMLSIPWGLTGGWVVRGEVEVCGGREAVQVEGGEGERGEEEEEEEVLPSMALFMSVNVCKAASGPELLPA
jgi:hypothetical protein